MNDLYVIVVFSMKKIVSSGNNFRHGEFDRYTYEFSNESYLACYGRGAIQISSLWLGSGAIARGDPVSFAKILFMYMHRSMHEIGFSISKTAQHYKSKVMNTEL